MYNNIGLQTPRGSGTSGYVSANKAKPKKMSSKLDFLKEMKSLRENILPPPRKANKDILEHKQKREVYVKLAELRQQLEKEGLEKEELEERLKQEEATLMLKYNEGVLNIENTNKSNADSHILAMVKEKEQEKLKEAFNIKNSYSYGSAFDFESQEKDRLERMYKKKLKELERKKKNKGKSRSRSRSRSKSK